MKTSLTGMPKTQEEGEESDGKAPPGASNGWITASNDVDMDNQIVLAEDKKYYPTAEEVYGEDVDTLVMDDEQPLEQPIIKPYGKTVFMDTLVEQTHHMNKFDENSEKHMRYTDTRIDEQKRRISIKAIPMLADGAVLIVDAAEGMMVNTERAIRHAIQERLPVVVVINKVDRLITELKLPPKDAYHKLRHTLEVINNHVSAATTTVGNVPVIDLAAGNVCFASASAGWSFTLQSFAKLYVKLHEIPFDAEKFASRLWGDIYYHPDTRAFKRKPPAGGG
ncbi:hypothetical protein CRYUN_Cryun02cG0169000 [Craigia yunnanensis]